MIVAALQLFWSCVKVGLLAFGGGNSAIPLLEAEVVPRWLTATEYGTLVSINFGLPGISMMKLAGMIGLRVAGVLGLIAATIGIAAPGLLLTIGVARLIAEAKDVPMMQKLLFGMKCAAAALLLGSAVRLMPLPARSATSWIGLAIVAGIFVGAHWFKLNPLVAVLSAMLAAAVLL